MGVYDVKMTIVWRNDLKLENGAKIPAGKIAAQVAHAALGAILNYTEHVSNDIRIGNSVVNRPYREGEKASYTMKVPLVVHDWLSGSFAKVVLKADNEAKLLELENECKRLSVNYKLITDNGTTCFGNKPTITCIAIGPDKREIVEGITKDLKLL